MNRKSFLKSGLVLCSILSFSASIEADKLKKANALMDVPGKKPVMVTVDQSNPDKVILNYKVPEAEIIALTEKYDNTELKRITLGNAPLAGNEGEPVLPVIPAQFVVPAGKSIASINIQRNRKKVLPGRHFIEFGKAPIPLTRNAKARKSFPDASIYSNDAAFPSQNGVLVSVQYKKGVKIAFVNLNPVQYYPKSGKIEVFSDLMLQVNLIDEKKGDRNHRLPTKKSQLDPLKLGIENPEALNTYENSSRFQLQNKKGGICSSDQQYSYVFITSQSIRDANTDVTVRDLIEHRISQGYTANIVTIEEIYSNYSGIDEAEQLRNFIIDAYSTWNTEYVVLGGDVNIIPYRNLYNDQYIPSDMYFQCLDGSYNYDGDLYWGEPNDGPDGTDVDLMAEVSIGRISAETPQEMANFIYKTLVYEKATVAPWLSRSCILGEELGPQFGPGEFAYAFPYMEEIRLGSKASGYSTVGFIDCPTFTSDTLYDNFTFFWSPDSLLKLINSNNYSIFNHLGHANETYAMKLEFEQADALTNSNPVFVYSQGCYPGHFPVDCMAERLTTSSRNGMFSVVFNTVYGYGSYNESRENLDGPSQRFNRQFWDAFFSEKILKLGDINSDSHEDNIWCINYDLIRYCMYETVLFGDPATMLRGQIEGPYLTYHSKQISDQNGGNNDSFCNPGESIEMFLTIQNVGSLPSENSTCSLVCTDANISIQSAISTLASIACCGDIQQTSSAFEFQIGTQCPTPSTINFELIINSADSTWRLQIPIQIYNPGQITGNVTANLDGSPINGANVFYSGPISGSSTTNENGSYTLNLVEGLYSIFVDAKGFLNSETLIVSIPPAAELNFRLYRPQMVIEPAAINHTQQPEDSISIPVQISNTGDFTLQVEIRTSLLSKPLLQRNPQLIDLETASADNWFSKNSKTNRRAVVLPKPYSPEKSFADGYLKVLYLHTMYLNPQTDKFIAGVKNIPSVKSLDVLDCRSTIPNLDYLMEYDCVLLSSDSYWVDPVLLGNILADYVDNGRLAIVFAATFSPGGDWQIKGKFAQPDYCPISTGGIYYYGCIATEFIEYEITRNINFIQSEIFTYSQSIQGQGIALGVYQCEQLLVGAYNPDRPIVAINVFPEDGYWSGDLIQMISNCFDWSTEKWLSINPGNAIFTIAPGSTELINVLLNSRNLFGGLYTGEIAFSHNDPSATNPFIVPVNMTVDGFRSLKITPPSLHFDNVWYGNSDTAVLILSNDGNETTTLSSLTIDDSAFYCLESVPIKVKAKKSTDLRVVFKPYAINSFNATLTISSDAEDNNIITIPLSGNAIEGPKAVVEPTTLDFNFNPNDSPADKTVVLSNAGVATLNYSISIRQNNQIKYQMTHSATPKVRKGLIYSQRNYKHPFAENRVIVGLKKGTNGFALSNILTQAGVKSVVELAKGVNPVTRNKAFTLRTLLRLELNASGKEAVLDAIKVLRKDPSVEFVEPDYLVKAVKIPNDPQFDQQYALNNNGQTGGTPDADIDAVEAWEVFTGSGEEIIIGVIDTGVDYLHPDLADNIWQNIGEIPDNGIDDDGNGYIDDYYGWDFAYDDNDPMDGDGHGTHCSGIIAAKGNNGIGVCGVMWNAKIMALKFLDDDGYGYTSDAIDAVDYAIAMNVPITSNSWGGGGYSQALQEVIAQSGIFVAAAGNDYSDIDIYPHYPSSYELDNIISVAATDHFDNKAEFSNYGKESVDLAAPGVDILSTTPNNQYEFYSGTSMATPYVSGAVGLSWSMNPTLASVEIRDAVFKAVDTISSMQGITVTGGRLNAKKLIDLIGPGWISITPFNSDSIYPSESREFTVTVNPENLFAGTRNAKMVFNTNDPFNPDVVVEVNVEIAGCKSVYAENENVDFGKVWEGRDTTVSITLINQCNDLVTVSGCSFDNSLFNTVMNFPAFLRPFDTLLLPVTFSPADASDNISAVALISSDADDNPSLTVNLSGKCVAPPIISLNPRHLKKTLDYGIQDTSTIMITNSGGADYQFKTKTKLMKNKGLALGNIADAELFVYDYYNYMLLKIDPETGNSFDTIKLDNQLYIYGMAYDGKFIYYTTGNGDISVLDLNTKELVRTIIVPQCRYMEAIGVTEQHIVITDSYDEKVFVLDKITGDIVTSWFSRGVYGLACVEADNSIFVVDYNNVVYEYDLMTGTLLNSYTPDTYYIHSLSYSGSAEVLFALDWDYIIYAIDPQNGSIIKEYPANYSVRSIAADEGTGKAKWIRLQSTEGIVPAGEVFALNTTITTEGLASGDYFAEIILQHFPDILPDISIPCTIFVSETNRLHSSPPSISFPEVWNGGIDSTVIYLVNDGNAATTVSSVSSSNKIFSVASSCPITVDPFDSIPFTIRCTPNKTGTVEGIITVKSNATDNPVLSIPVSATTVKPPKISIKPKSISLTTLPDLQSYTSIELNNSGGADYPFEVSSITDATNNPFATRLYANSNFHLVRLDPVNGEIIDTILPSTNAYSIAFDGEYIYLAYRWYNYINVVDPDNKYIVRSIYFPAYGIYGLAVTDDKLIGKGDDGTFYVINKSSEELLYSFKCYSNDADFTYCCHRNSIFIANNYSIEEHSIEDGSLINSFGYYYYPVAIAYSSDARMLMVDKGYSIDYLDPQNGNYLGAVNSPSYIYSLASDEVNVREWIRPMVKTAVVPKDGSVSIPVKINSTRLLPETYSANLIFEHPKGKAPGPFVINCKLKVKQLKNLAVNPENVNFGEVPVGSSKKEFISLENKSNDTITIKKITSSSKEINIISQPVPFKIPPYSATKIFPVYTPSARGIDAALITIKSNASNASNLMLNAYGTGINPPVIAISPQIFRDTLESGMTSSNYISISNTGEAEYEFSVFTIEDRSVPTRFGSGEQSDAKLFVATDSLIYSMDPVSGQLNGNGIAIPGYIRGLASDPEYLYASTDDTSGPLIYVIDLDSATVVRNISLKNRSLLGLGVGYDIIVGYDQNYSEVVIYNKEDGQLINSWSLPFYTAALTYSESRKSVFVFNSYYETIEERAIAGGSVINEFYGLYWITDCAFSERAGLLFVVNDIGTVYVLEPDYGYIYSELYTNLPITSLAADEGFSEIKWLKPYWGWGIVYPGETYTIDLGISAINLSAGIHSGSLVINPKGYGPGPLTVPCSLFVQIPSSASR
jgi:subtilisin family serine protease